MAVVAARVAWEREPAGKLPGLTVTVVSPAEPHGPPAFTTAVFITPPIVSVVTLCGHVKENCQL